MRQEQRPDGLQWQATLSIGMQAPWKHSEKASQVQLPWGPPVQGWPSGMTVGQVPQIRPPSGAWVVGGGPASPPSGDGGGAQALPTTLSPWGQLPHWPSAQGCPRGQYSLHWPQWFGSLERSTQTSPPSPGHAVAPAGQTEASGLVAVGPPSAPPSVTTDWS